MTRDDVIRRLCELQKLVWDSGACDPLKAADCFCDMSRHADFSERYQNAGAALEFIERAVLHALARARAVDSGGAPAEGTQT